MTQATHTYDTRYLVGYGGKARQVTLRVWVGTFGDYEIPDEFSDVKFKKNGRADRRYAKAKEFMRWVAAKEAKWAVGV
jgi:hypothetical protein